MPPAKDVKCKYLSLELEAIAILETMAVGVKDQGRLLSTLLRQEEQRRIVARQLREKIEAICAVEVAP